MKKTDIIALLLIPVVLCFGASGCSDTSQETQETETESAPVEDIVIAQRGEESKFRFVYDVDAKGVLKDNFIRIRDAVLEKIDVKILPYDDFGDEQPCEIIFCSQRREVCSELAEELERGEYAIKAVSDGNSKKIIIACNGEFAQKYAVDYFISEFINEDSVTVPGDLFVKGSCSDIEKSIIISTIDRLRDPCIIVEDGVYYAYGTGWVCYKNDSGSLEGKWKSLGMVAQVPANAKDNYWAPEVHKYNGEFYMFTTYLSSANGHRGCTIMKSSSPEGPFVEITDGHITPSDWDSIDGTFYVDPDGQPWMIFVHEWTSTDDGIGRMAAAKLSDDLTHFISEPIELFRADDPAWTDQQVTDGCWMYECEDGQLIMIWSNFDASGYVVGIARSDNGRVDGNWTHDDELLYSKTIAGTYDGGHGMIFTDTDGQMYLSIHSPNAAVGNRQEKPTFIPIREENGTLVWDIGE